MRTNTQSIYSVVLLKLLYSVLKFGKLPPKTTSNNHSVIRRLINITSHCGSSKTSSPTYPSNGLSMYCIITREDLSNSILLTNINGFLSSKIAQRKYTDCGRIIQPLLTKSNYKTINPIKFYRKVIRYNQMHTTKYNIHKTKVRMTLIKFTIISFVK